MRRVLLALLLVTGCVAPTQAAVTNPMGLNQWVPRALIDNLNEVRALGVGAVRVALPWQQVQPNPQQFDWSTTDATVAAARSAGIEVLFTVRSISAWGTAQPPKPGDPYHGASLPKSMSDWQHFVGALALRYAGQGVSYEIENEADTNFWAGSLDDYLTLLKASYAAIKAADPQAVVLASAVGCAIQLTYVTPLQQQNLHGRLDSWLGPILATRAYDVVNVHDYYFPSGPAINSYTFSSYLQHTLDMMAKAGVKNRPVWITETGFVSGSVPIGRRVDDGSPQKQAAWLSDAFRQAAQFGVERTFWLFLRDAGGTGYFDSMGLDDAQAQPKPAHQAYVNAGRH